MKINNLFTHLPQVQNEESVENLLKNDFVEIKRIVSHGEISEPDFWYDQDEDEWVLLIQGSAQILFEKEQAPTQLYAGDYLFIPAHQKHRIVHTDEHANSIWLAIHIKTNSI